MEKSEIINHMELKSLINALKVPTVKIMNEVRQDKRVKRYVSIK